MIFMSAKFIQKIGKEIVHSWEDRSKTCLLDSSLFALNKAYGVGNNLEIINALYLP